MILKLFSIGRKRPSHVNLVVSDSDLFDHETYSKSIGQHFNSRADAVDHYIRIGEAQGKCPSSGFNPAHYALMYPDVVSSGQCLLAHYVQYGRGEERLPYIAIDDFEVRGKRAFRPGHPCVAVVCHELSETGAPILGWNIAKEFPSDWNVIGFSLRGGTLREAFAEVTNSLFEFKKLESKDLSTRAVAQLVLQPIVQRFGVTHIVANSAVTYPVATAAAYLGIPVTMLVHEFADYLARKVIDATVLMSDHLVFSSDLTRESAKDVTGFNISNSSVFPQGKSEIPPVKTKGDGGYRLRQIFDTLGESKFLVIGCGHFQIRKGVDIFISAAKRMMDQLGRDNVSFIWVGNGYDPDIDHGYSVWIKDQIRRSDLSDVLHIISGLDGSDLGELYRRADVMFLSSRLDPYPNVVIDAVSIGLPVVCFAKTTGAAEHLIQLEDGEHLVAPYLDVVEAADRLIELYHDKELRARIGVQLKEFAREKFSMRDYIDRLIETFGPAKDTARRSAENVKTILDSGIVKLAFLCPPGSTHDMRSAVTEYVRAEERATPAVFPCKRRLFAGYSIEEYASGFQDSMSGVPPTVSWLQAGQPAGPWVRKVVDLSTYQSRGHGDLRSAVHIHAHYVDVLRQFLVEISQNKSRPDLLITTSSIDVRQVETLVADYQGKSMVLKVENRGRDLGPMLVDLADILQQYDVVGHIHTKKSFDVSDRKLIDAWTRFLMANTIGSAHGALDKILSLYASNPRIGLSFPEDPNLVGWTRNREVAKQLLGELDIHVPLKNNIEFPVGNFLFFRPEAVRPLFARGFKTDDLPAEPLPYDGTLLHGLERIWTIVCESRGFDWTTTTIPGVTR